jgi:hypothetical protein
LKTSMKCGGLVEPVERGSAALALPAMRHAALDRHAHARLRRHVISRTSGMMLACRRIPARVAEVRLRHHVVPLAVP